MKLLAFSDSHGHTQQMLDALADEAEDAVACFFLGDGGYAPDAMRESFPHLPLYSVRGNCDVESFEPADGLVPFGGLLFYYAHGHTLSVKSDLDSLWWAARRRKADAALYGHTHVAAYEFRNGVHLFNPGSIGLPRFGAPSYGRILVQDGTPTFEICKFSR